MKLIDEFKAFAVRGNVIDLAIAVIVGTAFGKIVSSLVEDIIMPPIGFLIGGVNFSNLAITLTKNGGEAVNISYGIFIQAVIDFAIIACVLFLVIRFINKFQAKKESEANPPSPSAEVSLLTEIRDLIKNKQ